MMVKLRSGFLAKLKSRALQNKQTNKPKKQTMVRNETGNVTIKPLVYISERLKAMLRRTIQSDKRPLKKV